MQLQFLACVQQVGRTMLLWQRRDKRKHLPFYTSGLSKFESDFGLLLNLNRV